MLRHETCPIELALWRLQRVQAFYGGCDERSAFMFSHRDGREADDSDPGSDYIGFLVACMLGGDVEIPRYLNKAYFKLPPVVRFLATAP